MAEKGVPKRVRASCVAIAEHGRINLIISKSEKGYDEFKKVLEDIEKGPRNSLSWYGYVEDLNGNERSGLIITNKD